MNKQSLRFLPAVLLMAVLCSGCQPASSTVETGENRFSNSACYEIDFLGVTEGAEVVSTWRYRVQGRACAQTLSYWTLELPACAAVVDASPGPWEIVSPELDDQISGIRWQTGTDFQNGEFSVILTGDLEKGMTRAGVEGQDLSVGRIDGPVCKDLSSPSGPLAKVNVQSANCRARPVGKADKIAVLYRNQETEILGRNDDPRNPWWYVKVPGQGGNCWLWGKTSTTTGNVDGLPIIK